MSYADEVLNLSPLAYWRFTETSGSSIADSAGSNTGTLVGTPTLNNASLIPSSTNPSINFPAYTDRMTLTDTSDLSGQDHSVVMTFKSSETNSTNQYRTLVQFGKIGFSASYTGTNVAYHRKVGGTTYVWNYNGGQDPATNHFDGVARHFVATYNATTGNVTFYIDGVQLFQDNSEGSGISAGSTFEPPSGINGDAGSTSDPHTRGMVAEYDDVAVFGTELTPAQVTTLSNAHELTDPGNPLSYWNFNEDSLTHTDQFGASDITFGSGVTVNQTGLFGDATNKSVLTSTPGTVYISPPVVTTDITFTVMFWIKPTEVTGENILIRDQGNIEIGINSGVIHYYRGGFHNSTVAIAPDETAHIAIAATSTEVKFYKNGLLGDTKAVTTSTTPEFDNMFGVNSSFTYNGYIDEIAIYNSTLTQAQIDDIYTNGVDNFGGGTPEVPTNPGTPGTGQTGNVKPLIWDNTANLIREFDSTVDILPGSVDASGNTFTNATATPYTVGGIPAGSTFDAVALTDMWLALLYPYVAPTISSFSLNSNPTPLEIGDTYSSGNITFTFSFTNPENLDENSVSIESSTHGVLASGLALNSSPATVSLPGNITNTATATETFTIKVQETGQSLLSRTTTIEWYWRTYYGSDPDTSVVEAEIEGANFNFVLEPDRPRTYTLTAAGSNHYLYMVWPTEFGDKVAIKDPDGFAIAVVEPPAMQNITNSFGHATNYYVYRTFYPQNGTIVAVVT